jgi:hypothetical protein
MGKPTPFHHLLVLTQVGKKEGREGGKDKEEERKMEKGKRKERK